MIMASAGSLFWVQTVAAQAPAEFYSGKTVRIVIGAATGGEYGLYAQLAAQHIGKFVPGKPTVIVQSMPGAGGINSLNHLANVAAQDGTVLSIPQVNIVQDGLLSPNARFDPGEFQWIGRLREQSQVGVVLSKSNVRSLADARAKELTAGATGASNPSALNLRILNAMAGTKFRIVTGYKGTHEVSIAWERGEVDVLTTGWDNITRRYGDQLKAGLIHPLYVYAMQAPRELAHVPLITRFGRNDAEKAFLHIYTIGAEIGRALAFPPGVPAHRVGMWRTAFMQMLADPEFKKAVAKGNIQIDPLDGATLAASVNAVVTLPKETIALAGAFYARLLAEAK
jgi:tripartite-type tricarboxylate transporter receptor subunit TctC